MRKGILAIYDYEQDYAYHLMDYLKQKEELQFEVGVFTNQNSLDSYLVENSIDILLVGDDILPDNWKSENIGMIVILTEQNRVYAEETMPTIYKFQSAEHILKEILQLCTQQDVEVVHNCSLNQEKTVDLIGVISPYGGSGKSTFAIALGQILSKHNKVLLLNLEALPGHYNPEAPKEAKRQGISDLIYYVKQKKSNIATKMISMVQKLGSIDFILPVDHYSDLYEMTKEDVETLICEIKNNTSYRYIILDIGYISDSTCEFLKYCSKIYLPMVGDFISKEKKESFQRIFKVWEEESLLQRMEEIQIPYDELIAKGEFRMNQIDNTKVGQYINQIIEHVG